MKKIISLVLAFFLLLPAFVSAENYTSMTTDELLSMLDAIRVELATRKLDNSEEKVLVDAEGIKWYITGDPILKQYSDGNCTLILNAIITNSTDADIIYDLKDTYINGWSISCSCISTLPAGKKEKREITFYRVHEKCELSDITQLDDIEFHFTICSQAPNGFVIKDVVRLLFK